MATFHTHLSVAAAGSLLATGAITQYQDLYTTQLIILACLGTLGGLLPDIDSDHSIPAQWAFRLLSLASCFLTIYYLQRQISVLPLFILAASIGLIMRYGVLKLFEKTTVHRGLFHSLPAALLAGLGCMFLSIHVFSSSASFAFLTACFVCGGYCLHLLLDELYSVDLLGRRLKASFGTAFTLFQGHSWASYCFLYSLVLIIMMFLPMPNMIAQPLAQLRAFF